MSTIKQYIELKANGDIKIRRRLESNFIEAGVSVTSTNITQSYKKTIDDILAKMKLKRAPLQGRVPTKYEATLGEHDRKVLAGVDPLDGQKLEKVFINDEREAMYNPRTHIVWPLPVSNVVSTKSI
jgi:hypothetical protein